MLCSKNSGPAWLVVGLGNPGAQYEGSRHYGGWRALDALAGRAGVEVRRARFHALTAEAVIAGQGVLLM